MATLKKTIDGEIWELEIPDRYILDITHNGDNIKVRYRTDMYNNWKTITCSSVKF